MHSDDMQNALVILDTTFAKIITSDILLKDKPNVCKRIHSAIRDALYEVFATNPGQHNGEEIELHMLSQHNSVMSEEVSEYETDKKLDEIFNDAIDMDVDNEQIEDDLYFICENIRNNKYAQLLVFKEY